MTPASTTPTFSGTGTPAGVVKGFDQVPSAPLEPVVASSERGLHLIRTATAKHQGALALRPDFDRELLSRPPAERAPYACRDHHLPLGAEPSRRRHKT